MGRQIKVVKPFVHYGLGGSRVLEQNWIFWEIKEITGKYDPRFKYHEISYIEYNDYPEDTQEDERGIKDLNYYPYASYPAILELCEMCKIQEEESISKDEEVMT